MKNAELIKALRRCGTSGSPAERCWDCAYYDREPWCEAALANDAADALEAAEKRIAGMEKGERMKKKHLIEQIRDYESEVSRLKANLNEAGSKIREYEQGLLGECVGGSYCKACSHGIEIATFYGAEGRVIEWDCRCDLAVPCTLFDRKDCHEQQT